MQTQNLILIKNTNKMQYDISNDYTLPDYIPDVKRLVNTDTRVILHNVFINHNSIVYEGEVVYSAVLICEDECIRNVTYSEDFSVEVNNENADQLNCHECIVDNSAIRLISSRKLNCKAKILTFSKQSVDVNTSPKLKDSTNTEEAPVFEKKYLGCEYMTVDEKSVNSLHASQDLELPKDSEEISSVIYCKVDVIITEQKYIENKLYLKGDVSVSVLYESVNSCYVKTVIHLPFSDAVDDIEPFNGCLCNIEVNDIRAAVTNNSFGEMKKIELDYTYNIICRTYTAHLVEVIDDLYATDRDTECSYGRLDSLRFDSVIISNLSVENDFLLDEGEDVITDAIDCFCTVDGCHVSSEQGKVSLTGTLKCDLLLKSDGYTNQSYTLPFKFEKNIENCISDPYNEYSVKIARCSVDIDKNKIFINVELIINIMLAERCEYRYVTAVETEGIAQADTTPMIIYYPDKNDSLWDVAKKFRSTCADIKSANGITGNSLDGVRVLLLPRKKSKNIKTFKI